MSPDDLKIAIDGCFREEARAARDEYSAVARRDHHAAALAHKDRWHWLDRAGKYIEQLP